MVTVRGVILDYVKWKESSIILRVYTNQFGLRSYIINSVFKKSPKYSPILFNPLNILEMVVYTKSKSINYVKDLRPVLLFHQINLDPLKLISSHFISEIITKGIRENQLNDELFSFIENHIYRLYQSESDNILKEVIIFMIFFTGYLGYGLRNAEQLNLFDRHRTLLDKNQVAFVNNLLNLNFDDKGLANIELLGIVDSILGFLQCHIVSYKFIKSSKVLSSYVSIPF